jgi:hypothetical protein
MLLSELASFQILAKEKLECMGLCFNLLRLTIGLHLLFARCLSILICFNNYTLRFKGRKYHDSTINSKIII